MKEVDHLVALLNGRMERFDRSRNIQWKINGTLWAGLIVVIGFIQANPQVYVPCWAVVATTLIITGMHAISVRNIQHSLDWDKKLIEVYHAEINKQLNDAGSIIEEYLENGGNKSFSWRYLQSGITALICLAGVLLTCDFCYQQQCYHN